MSPPTNEKQPPDLSPGAGSQAIAGAADLREPSPPLLALNRRTVLRAGAAGSFLAVALPLACGQGGGSVPTGPIAAGNVSAVSVGALMVLANENVVLGRDAQGLYAMSAVCTHQGCTVGASSNGAGLFCGCHGSAFDRYGAVTHSPASAPLPHLQVDLAANGDITIQGGTTVAASTRTAVPA